jgi:Trypsin-co-occurring domain 1
LGSLGELVKILEASIGDLPKRPDKIEMEFGAKLSTDCNLWIVSGEGEAEFKVTLSWEKSDHPAPKA